MVPNCPPIVSINDGIHAATLERKSILKVSTNLNEELILDFLISDLKSTANRIAIIIGAIVNPIMTANSSAVVKTKIIVKNNLTPEERIDITSNFLVSNEAIITYRNKTLIADEATRITVMAIRLNS